MQVFCTGQMLRPQPVKSLLHRIKGFGRAGQNGVFHQGVEVLRQVITCQIDQRQPATALTGSRCGVELGDFHAVLGQSTGLVHAQHRSGAQGLDGSDTTGKHLLARQPPGAQRRNDGQDHGELLGQQRHRQGQPSQQRSHPVAMHQSVGQHQRQAHEQRNQGQHLYQPSGLAAQG